MALSAGAVLSCLTSFLFLVVRFRENQRPQSSWLFAEAVGLPVSEMSEIRMPSHSSNWAALRDSRRMILPSRNQEMWVGFTWTAHTCQPEVVGLLPLLQPDCEALSGGVFTVTFEPSVTPGRVMPTLATVGWSGSQLATVMLLASH